MCCYVHDGILEAFVVWAVMLMMIVSSDEINCVWLEFLDFFVIDDVDCKMVCCDKFDFLLF